MAWASDVFVCLYLVWNYLVLMRHTSAIRHAVEGLGVEMPKATAFVLANHSWLYPAVFGGAALVVIAKEAWLHDKRLSVAVTFTLALLVLWVSDYIKTVLFYPLLGLLEKLA